MVQTKLVLFVVVSKIHNKSNQWGLNQSTRKRLIIYLTRGDVTATTVGTRGTFRETTR